MTRQHCELFSVRSVANGGAVHLQEQLLCKLDRALQLLHSFCYFFSVFNNFGESASRSK
jgi:hypothetical protein